MLAFLCGVLHVGSVTVLQFVIRGRVIFVSATVQNCRFLPAVDTSTSLLHLRCPTLSRARSRAHARDQKHASTHVQTRVHTSIDARKIARTHKFST